MKRKNKQDVVKSKEFRKNNARTGHPAYIVKIYKSTDKRKAEFIGLTKAPKTHGVKNIELEKNPNPNETETTYVRPNIEEVELTKKTFGKKLEGWKFSNKDEKVVKGIISKNKKNQHVGKSKR